MTGSRGERFVRSPNLPESEVTELIVSDAVPALTQALVSRGIRVHHPEHSDVLQDATARHADMLCLHLGENNIAVAKEQGKLMSRLRQAGMKIVFVQELEEKYPSDCRLNALILGNTLFGNICSCEKLKICAESNNIRMIDVKQGYTRCSSCVVSEKAIITSDTAIERAAKSAGIDVLLVPPGEIVLEGYDYGFIGGASAKLSATELAFTGKVSALSYYDRLESFCHNYGVTATELTQLPLFDIGGMVQIKEKIE